MVLKNAIPAAEFESVDDDVMIETPAAVEPALPVAARPKTAIAKADKVNVADFDVMAALENRLPPVEFGEGTRLVGSNGQVMDSDKKLLGDNVTLLCMSWNKRFVISPGVDGEKAKQLARYSMDGKVTSQGEDVAEYLKDLKDQGYEKAALKEYVDLFGLLLAAGKATDHVGKAITISLSPDSVKAFSGFRLDLVVQGVTGRLPEGLDPNAGIKLNVSTEIKSAGPNTWTRLVTKLGA
jgi:hypothetical protein